MKGAAGSPDTLLRSVRAVSAALAAILLATATQMSPAQTLDGGSTVRITLRDSTVVRGRLKSGAVARLTVIADTKVQTIDRADISRLDRRSNLTSTFAKGFAIAGIVIGGVATRPSAHICDTPAESPLGGVAPRETCGRSRNELFVGGLVLGGLFGFTSGSVAGTFIPTWRRADPDLSTVAEDDDGRFSAPRCNGDNSIAIGLASQPHEGGHAEHIAMSLQCEPATTTRVEVGVLWPRQTANTSFAGNDASVVYSGIVLEHRIARLPLDPRLVAGVGLYHGSPRPAGWSGTVAGGSVGLNVGMQLSPTTSLRLEGREHYFRGSIGTIGLGFEYRP